MPVGLPRALVPALVLSASLATAAPAQQAPPLPAPGARVRLHIDDPPDHLIRIGRFVGRAGDTLLVDLIDGGPTLRTHVHDVGRLEVSRGTPSRKSMFLRYSWAPGLAGLAVGFGVSRTVFCEKVATEHAASVQCLRESRGPDSAIPILGAAGYLLGGLIGVSLREERWQRVPLPRAIDLIADGRLGVSISLPR